MNSQNDSNMKLIGSIPRGDREEIRVCLTEYRGKKKLDIRSWFRPDGQEEMVATKRGVTIRLEDLNAFMAFVQEAEQVIKAELSAAQITTGASNSN